jgi:isoquinoline 1-oxidoreductase beta subunit
MSAGLEHEITIDRGRVEQTDFNNDNMLRVADFPTKIDICHLNKFEQISGAGEEVIPAIMPAICNAIFAATGKRLRTLPL